MNEIDKQDPDYKFGVDLNDNCHIEEGIPNQLEED